MPPSFIGFFIYLSPLIFIYTQCKSLSGGQASIKIPIVSIDRAGADLENFVYWG